MLVTFLLTAETKPQNHKNRTRYVNHADLKTITLRSLWITGGCWLCICWTALQVCHKILHITSTGSGELRFVKTSTKLPPGNITSNHTNSTNFYSQDQKDILKNTFYILINRQAIKTITFLLSIMFDHNHFLTCKFPICHHHNRQ